MVAEAGQKACTPAQSRAQFRLARNSVSRPRRAQGAIFTHADLDAVFLNINVIATVNKKFLLELEAEREKWPDVNYAPIIKNSAKQMKGCYTRYVNNYDAAEQHLIQLKSKDKEKHRYLEVCKTHPEANGLDVRRC